MDNKVHKDGVYPLFPTPVAVYQLGRDFTKEELTYMRECLQNVSPNEGNNSTSITNVLHQPAMKSLLTFCSESVQDYSENVQELNDGKASVTQSWINISKTGQYHHTHHHANSLWSGVLYIQTSEPDKIVFYAKRGHTSFQLTPYGYNIFNSNSWWIPAVSTQLFIFPSHLEHSVPPTTSTERISLSFNTFPTTQIGAAKSLNLLDFTSIPRNQTN